VRVLVAGLGAAGSATVYHLARAGVETIGVDPWSPPHLRGSTHGSSRIHRRAYMEGPAYLPLLERADTLWEELEREAGIPLLRRTGALMVGPRDGELVAGSGASAEAGGIPVEHLSGAELRRRFPLLVPGPGMEGLFEPGAGVLDPEACVRAHLAGAEAAGAELRLGEGLVGWEATSDGVVVRTGRSEWVVDHLVLAVGPWTPTLLARHAGLDASPLTRVGFGPWTGEDATRPSRAGGGATPSESPPLPGFPGVPPLRLERQVTGYFTARGGGPVEGVPVLMVDRGEEPLLYCIPERDGTLKAGLHHGGDVSGDPSRLRRQPLQDDEVRIAAPLGELIPAVEPRWVGASVCLYTNAPGGRWLIDALPGEPAVTLVSACSGHGFKASCAIGEAVSAMARGESPALSLEPFALL